MSGPHREKFRKSNHELLIPRNRLDILRASVWKNPNIEWTSTPGAHMSPSVTYNILYKHMLLSRCISCLTTSLCADPCKLEDNLRLTRRYLVLDASSVSRYLAPHYSISIAPQHRCHWNLASNFQGQASLSFVAHKKRNFPSRLFLINSQLLHHSKFWKYCAQGSLYLEWKEKRHILFTSFGNQITGNMMGYMIYHKQYHLPR